MLDNMQHVQLLRLGWCLGPWEGLPPPPMGPWGWAVQFDAQRHTYSCQKIFHICVMRMVFCKR
jgi:hypothetical protein